MAIDDPTQYDRTSGPKPASTNSSKGVFVAVFVILALLAIGEIHSYSSMNALRTGLQAQQTNLQNQIEAQVEAKEAAIQNSDAQTMDQLRAQLDDMSSKMNSSQRKTLARSRFLLTKLQKEQAQNAAQIQQELSQKADASQVGSLSQSFDATKTDLDTTKATVGTLASDLGMARSSMGTLIATNHQQIVELRRLGQRDYFEFTLTRNQEKTLAGVGLVLKKANVKHHMFTLNLIADDMTIPKKNRTIDEPLFFATRGSRTFYELVVNQVQSGQVTGYISTPKGAVELAAKGSSMTADSKATATASR
ncbi:MAG TPA: hypothetical protein VMX16_19255 [Terriglobia bacterium]|nr:hypothetical protein [Terriglobia bacterium]